MRTLYSIVSVLFLYSGLFSQNNFSSVNGIIIAGYSKVTGLPLMVSVNESKNLSVEKFPQWFNKEFLQNEKSAIKVTTNEQDNSGMVHYRFEQTYQGIKIENAMIIAHSNHNVVNFFNGDWYATVNPSNGISLTEQQSLQFALTKINAQTYKWENEAEERHMKEVLNDPSFTYKPKGTLVILPVTDKKQNAITFLYAYKFNIYAEKPLYRANVYVDATTGTVIREQNLICTSDVPSTATTKFSGIQSMTTDNYGTNLYRLRETGRGGGIETYNLNNSMNYSNTDFTNSSTNWSSTGTDQVATDAHWGAEKTYDYFQTTFNRNSIDNNGLKLLSYVHYGVNFSNAFWDGQRMTYGDGDLSDGYKEFTALDVCGHEISHGLVQYTAQLSFGEADALNEAFADIFGTAVEWFARPSQHNWLMGDELTTNGDPLRNMSNPNALQQPDTYLGNYWDQNEEPHQNNGPCIYWYYLLSIGGNGTNDNGQTYNITGISMAKASAIAYRALSVYMTPGTDYNSVRMYTIQAAKDLYGSCSNEAIQTTNAWYAVGVGSQYNPGLIGPAFSADQLTACVVPSTINFTNQTNSASAFIWRFGDGNTSTASNPAHTYTASGIYSVKLVATGCSGTTKDSVLKTAYINVSPNNPCVYTMSNTSPTYNTCTGILYDDGGANANYNDNTTKQITISLNPGNLISVNFSNFDMEATYDFVYIYKGPTASGSLIGSYTGNTLPNSGLSINTNTNVITIVQSSDQYLNEIGFKLQWTCSLNNVGIEDMDSNAGISIYPNPVSDYMTLDNVEDVSLMEITNALGQLQQSVKPNGLSSITVPTDKLASGVYIIKLYTGGKILTKKVIKH